MLANYYGMSLRKIDGSTDANLFATNGYVIKNDIIIGTKLLVVSGQNCTIYYNNNLLVLIILYNC